MKQQLLEAENRSLRQSLEVRTAALIGTQKALECCVADFSAMRDERDRLRAALEPFAEVAEGSGWDALKSKELVHVYSSRLSAGCYIEAGTFRRARAVLNPEDA